MDVSKPINTAKKFIQTQAFGAVLLLFSAGLAFYFANSSFHALYNHWLQKYIGPLSLLHWINDGLMVLFFFVVGLEIKREILVGELSSRNKAALPIIAAFGGAVVPALIYYFLNPSPDAIRGWGIPMATDIAFAVGILSLFSNRVPVALKVFLLALAIADDLLAVVVIAVFYTEKISMDHLLLALCTLGAITLLKKFKYQSYLIYTIFGVVMWFFVFKSGIHATVAGVVLGLLTPLTIQNSTKEPIRELIHYLHPWITFFVMPVFALANAGVTVRGLPLLESLSHPVTYGVFLGLFIGKPLGVMATIFLAEKLKLVSIPKSITKIKLLGVAHLTGIGFTMAIFICGLSLSPALQNEAKIGIILASILSAIVGAFYLFIK